MSKSKIKKSKGIQFRLLEIDKDGEIEFPHRLSKLIDKFSFKPDKEYKKYYFDNFNGKDIYYYSIKNEMCFTYREFSKYIQIPDSTLRKAFERIRKKSFDDTKELVFIEGRDYFKIFRNDFILNDEMSLDKKGDKYILFLTLPLNLLCVLFLFLSVLTKQI